MPYQPRLKPREHQRTARRRIDAAPTPHFALLMEMGTGKSKVLVDEWGERAAANDLRDLLIVAPSGCYGNWGRDDEEDPGELLKHLDPEIYERARVATWRSSGGRRNLDAVREVLLERERPRVLVVNCEAVSAVENARKACRYFLSQSRGAMVAVDESTIIKGESIRTDEIISMGHMPRVGARRIMTGLVTPNSPLDLYWQFEFLDPRILRFRNFFTFKMRYAVMQEMKNNLFYRGKDGEIHQRKKNPMQTVAYRNEEELTGKIAPHSYRVLKEECLDLPKKQYLPVREVPLHKEQARVYREMLEFSTAYLDSQTYVTATMVLAQRLRLDQILCGFVSKDEVSIEREIPEHRTDALLEVIEETMGKIIIWTSHDYSVRKITKRLREEHGPASVAQFWGGNRSTRLEDERRFKLDPRCRFMVSTPAAGGMGNTWTVAGLSIFYNNSDRLDHRLQAEDRVHRDGLREGAGRADYLDLVVPGTIDTKKIKNLRRKLDAATIINGDNYREWLI